MSSAQELGEMARRSLAAAERLHASARDAVASTVLERARSRAASESARAAAAIAVGGLSTDAQRVFLAANAEADTLEERARRAEVSFAAADARLAEAMERLGSIRVEIDVPSPEGSTEEDNTLRSYVDAAAIEGVRVEALSRIASLTCAAADRRALANTLAPLQASLVESLGALERGQVSSEADLTSSSSQVNAAVDAQHLDFATLEASMEQLREGAQRVERDAMTGDGGGNKECDVLALGRATDSLNALLESISGLEARIGSALDTVRNSRAVMESRHARIVDVLRCSAMIARVLEPHAADKKKKRAAAGNNNNDNDRDTDREDGGKGDEKSSINNNDNKDKKASSPQSPSSIEAGAVTSNNDDQGNDDGDKVDADEDDPTSCADRADELCAELDNLATWYGYFERSYEALVAEIGAQAQREADIAAAAARVAGELDTLHDAELQRRSEFSTAHGRFLPAALASMATAEPQRYVVWAMSPDEQAAFAEPQGTGSDPEGQ